MSMNIPSPSPCSSSSSSSFPSAIHWLSPLPLPPSTTTTSTKPNRPFSLQATPHTATDLSLPNNNKNNDQTLLLLLRQRKTEQAWTHYSQSPHLPTPTCLSRLVSQLSYQSTPQALSRARSIITRLRNENQLHRLDANSLGLLASSSAKSGHTLYASSLIKSMLRSGYLPHVKAWSAVVSRLSTESPSESINLFDSVTRRIRRFSDPLIVADSKPDTAAYNAVLNACANLGDKSKFSKLFDEMSEWDCEPDVLTYNVMIKLCARVDRKDLLVFVLERIIEKRIRFCMTTLHSLVAAYVGFDDLDTAERIVQAMREGRNDLCKILRDANLEDLKRAKEDDYDDDYYEDEYKEEEGTKDSGENKRADIVFEKLLPNSIEPSSEPPLLPKVYAPNSRIFTTLMKGYMKVGRVTDTVRTLEAMRHQDDKASHPDHVTYTTVVSAFVKAGLMDRAREVLAEMTRIRVPANRITYNILLKGYCQKLQIDKAKELLREMADDAGIKPDVVSYNILIDGCILIDDSSGALKFFNEMREQGITPTKISYTTLMKAFALSGQPKLANKVSDEMFKDPRDEMFKDPRVKADLVAWNMLVEGYCRLGLIEEAKKVIERMKENGFYPNFSTYGSLANGIALARKPGEALLLWKEIQERCQMKMEEITYSDSPHSPPPLKPDEGLLEALVDICVRAAFCKKALEIIIAWKRMGYHQIRPNKRKSTWRCIQGCLLASMLHKQGKIGELKRRERLRHLSSGWVCLILIMGVSGIMNLIDDYIYASGLESVKQHQYCILSLNCNKVNVIVL